MTTIKIFTDGGSRGNPGPAACAFVVESDSKIIFKNHLYLGKTTNNVAEYSGLLEAVKWLFINVKKHKVDQVLFLLDSELIVNQMNKLYKIKNENLKRIYNDILLILEKLEIKYFFKHIPRINNKRSDFLVNKCLDENKNNFTLRVVHQ